MIRWHSWEEKCTPTKNQKKKLLEFEDNGLLFSIYDFHDYGYKVTFTAYIGSHPFVNVCSQNRGMSWSEFWSEEVNI